MIDAGAVVMLVKFLGTLEFHLLIKGDRLWVACA
jgi:hypothetical protein